MNWGSIFGWMFCIIALLMGLAFVIACFYEPPDIEGYLMDDDDE